MNNEFPHYLNRAYTGLMTQVAHSAQPQNVKEILFGNLNRGLNLALGGEVVTVPGLPMKVPTSEGMRAVQYSDSEEACAYCARVGNRSRTLFGFDALDTVITVLVCKHVAAALIQAEALRLARTGKPLASATVEDVFGRR